MKSAGTITVLAVLVLHWPVMAQDQNLARRGDRAAAAHETSLSPVAQTGGERPAPTPEDDAPFRYHKTEVEPNDDPSIATSISWGYYGSGEISPVGDIDWWGTGWQKSSQLVDLVFAYCDTSLSSNRDSQLNVYTYDWVNLTLVEFDDDDGPDLSSCVAGAVVPQGSTVLYRLNDYQDNGEIAPYDLHQLLSIDQGNPETEPNNDSGTANSMDIMLFQSGSLPAGDLFDWFIFTANAGDLLVVIMDDDPDDDGNVLDTDLTIIAGDGSTILAEGDNGIGDGNCAGAVVAPAGGVYFVRVADGGFGGGDIDYRFVVLINGVLVPVELQSLSIE